MSCRRTLSRCFRPACSLDLCIDLTRGRATILWFSPRTSFPDNLEAEVDHGSTTDRLNGLGYIGRTGVFEVWRLDAEDRALIQSHADEKTIRDRLLDRGFSTLVDDAVQKAQRRLTSGSEVRRLAANYPG